MDDPESKRLSSHMKTIQEEDSVEGYNQSRTDSKASGQWVPLSSERKAKELVKIEEASHEQEGATTDNRYPNSENILPTNIQVESADFSQHVVKAKTAKHS